MTQLQLALLCRLDAPSVLPDAYIAQCLTYRDAVRLCWSLRRVRLMTTLTLAETAGFPTHLRSCFLSDDDTKRDLPAKYIRGFEMVAGNTAISQFIARQAKLTILEEFQARATA